MPASIGAVFFSKQVALPFAKWRMLRHGYDPELPFPFSLCLQPLVWLGLLRISDLHYEEKHISPGLKGLWVIADETRRPDVIIYYLHGGGFAMGSPWFYLEFLMAWATLLRDGTAAEPSKMQPSWKTSPAVGRRFRNPAVFAPDYTLVPHATFPTQLKQVLRGYEYSVSQFRSPQKHNRDSSKFTNGSTTPQAGPNGQQASTTPKVVLSGDSAGSTLALSLLLLLASKPSSHPLPPQLAALISPWCRLVSVRNQDTPSDYLNAESLHLYAKQYVGIGLDTGKGSDHLRTVESSSNGLDESANRPQTPRRLRSSASPPPAGTPTSTGLSHSRRESAEIDAARFEISRNQKQQSHTRRVSADKKRVMNSFRDDDATAISDPLASPGDCQSETLWRRACPTEGYYITYGSEEVFAPEVEALVKKIEAAGWGGRLHNQGHDRRGHSRHSSLETSSSRDRSEDHSLEARHGNTDADHKRDIVRTKTKTAGVHAWPVVALFLGNSKEERLEGLCNLAESVTESLRT